MSHVRLSQNNVMIIGEGKISNCTSCWANPAAESHREQQTGLYRVCTWWSPTSHFPAPGALSYCPALPTSKGDCLWGNLQGSAAALHLKSPGWRCTPPAASHSVTMGPQSRDAPPVPTVMWHALAHERHPLWRWFHIKCGGEVDARDGGGKQTPSLPEGLR